MKHLFLTLTLILTLGFPLYAYAESSSPVIVQVKGMVCDFCAQSIMKVFERDSGLSTENISISLETQEITLDIPADLEITDEQIEKFIYYAGYDLVGITRPEDQELESRTPDHSSDQ